MGATIIECDAIEITPDAGSETQKARYRLIEAVKATGAKNQKALGDYIGISRQAVSKLLKKAGVTIKELVKLVEKILSTTSIKDNIGLVDFIQNPELRWFLGLEPMAMASVMATIEAVGFDFFVSKQQKNN